MEIIQNHVNYIERKLSNMSPLAYFLILGIFTVFVVVLVICLIDAIFTDSDGSAILPCMLMIALLLYLWLLLPMSIVGYTTTETVDYSYKYIDKGILFKHNELTIEKNDLATFKNFYPEKYKMQLIHSFNLYGKELFDAQRLELVEIKETAEQISTEWNSVKATK